MSSFASYSRSGEAEQLFPFGRDGTRSIRVGLLASATKVVVLPLHRLKPGSLQNMKVQDNRKKAPSMTIGLLNMGDVFTVEGVPDKFFIASKFVNNTNRIAMCLNGNPVELHSNGNCTRVDGQFVIS